MSDTPRTDAEPTYKTGIARTRTINIAFARQLERELAEKTRLLSETNVAVIKIANQADEYLQQRNVAIAKVEELRVRFKRELADAKEQLRLCNVDQFTTAAELDETKAQRDLAVEALKIIGECLIMKVKFPENATAAITASMIKKVLEECGE